jgi:hypothetical protein
VGQARFAAPAHLYFQVATAWPWADFGPNWNISILIAIS